MDTISLAFFRSKWPCIIWCPLDSIFEIAGAKLQFWLSEFLSCKVVILWNDGRIIIIHVSLRKQFFITASLSNFMEWKQKKCIQRNRRDQHSRRKPKHLRIDHRLFSVLILFVKNFVSECKINSKFLSKK